MHRLCKKAGADRVSEEAAKELSQISGGDWSKDCLKKHLIILYMPKEKRLKQRYSKSLLEKLWKNSALLEPEMHVFCQFSSIQSPDSHMSLLLKQKIRAKEI